MTWRYQVGELDNPRPNDAKFDAEEQAREHAHALACGDPSVPIAVWDDDNDVVSLFLCGQEFKPA